MGARHTSIQIQRISASVAIPQLKRRCSCFRGDSPRDEGVEAATEDEAAAAATYPWVAAAAAAAAAAAMMAGRSGTPGPMASPALLPRAVHPLLPCPLWVQHFLQASLLRLRCPISWVPGCRFWRLLIFFRAPPRSCMLWRRINQGDHSFLGPWRLLMKAGPGDREPFAWFRLRNPE